MVETIQAFFQENFPPELAVFFISMVPLIECRGAIPFGMLVLNMPLWEVLPIAIAGNILGAKSGTAEISMNDTFTNRATLVAYDENYIVVVSRIEAGSYGIGNKSIMEDLFDYLSVYGD